MSQGPGLRPENERLRETGRALQVTCAEGAKTGREDREERTGKGLSEPYTSDQEPNRQQITNKALKLRGQYLFLKFFLRKMLHLKSIVVFKTNTQIRCLITIKRKWFFCLKKKKRGGRKRTSEIDPSKTNPSVIHLRQFELGGGGGGRWSGA